jgi:hypothetical protein
MTVLMAETASPLAPDPLRAPPETARIWSAAPPTPGPTPTASAVVAPPEAKAIPSERSSGLVALFTDAGPRANALRAGAGMLAIVPFAFVSSLAMPAPLAHQALASVTLPLALALVATVGLTASAIGVSLLSHALAPRDAVEIGTRGLLRVGMVLAGLTPLVGLWVASYREGEALIVPTLAWAIAGISGLSTMNGGLFSAVHPRGSVTVGSLVVIVLLTLFTVAVGIRLWAAFVMNLDIAEVA